MMRCVLPVALVLAACSNTDGPPPVVDAPAGYTGPVSLTIQNYANATQIVSEPPGLACPGSCTAEFPIGTAVNLSFATRANYLVGLWSSPCEVSTGDSFHCRVMLDGSTTITVDGGEE